jgi:hypothetical protein
MSNMKRLAKARHAKVGAPNKPSNSPKATVNRAGGVAFEISDPAVKLITMTGGSFFAEPKYYSINEPVRDSDGKISNLIQRIRKIEDNVSFVNCDELDDTAQEVISTAVDVANSNDPRDVLRIASWLRNDMNIRLTPQVLLVIASQLPEAQAHIDDFANEIILRPDEVKTCLMLHRFFFGHKCLKPSLDRALGKAMSKFGEKALLKYNSKAFPTWKDVLCWIKRESGFPLSKALADYFIKGEVSEKGTPIVHSRKQLAKCKTFNAEARELAKKSGANWEVLVSQFGGSKEVWTFLLDNGLVKYMAMLRNLRNFLEAGVDDDTVDMICKYLSNKENVMRSKQLPFRFLSAYNVVESLHGIDSRKRSKFLEAIEDAIDISIENMDDIEGLTVVFHDTSGSMGQTVSANSTVTCNMAGAMLAAIIAKKSKDAYIGAFSDIAKEVAFTKRDSVIAIAKRLMATDVGWSTHTYKIMEWVKKKGIKPARIIITSDMQCYGRSSWGSGSALCDLWDSFRKSDKGRDCWMHSIHLNGSGDTPVDEKGRVNLTAGFSEKILQQLMDAEVRDAGSDNNPSEEGKSLPSIQAIREMYP